MTLSEWTTDVEGCRDFVKDQLEIQQMPIKVLADRANLAIRTIIRFLEGFTFSPHLRTYKSMVDALGHCLPEIPKDATVEITIRT
jgi:hypothetical protein